MLGPRADEIGRVAARAEIVAGAVEDPGAERVEPVEMREIEDDAPLVADGRDEVGDAALDRRRLVGGPAPDKRRAQLVAEMVDVSCGSCDDVARRTRPSCSRPIPWCR